MDKIKPCPFCGGNLVLSWHGGEDVYLCDCCGVRISLPQSSITHLTDIVNTRYEPPNEPLTLDELKQMEGEPVWVKPINLHEWICDAIDGKPDWGMVRKSWVNVWRKEKADLVRSSFDFEDYTKTWLAYRAKPKKGTS